MAHLTAVCIVTLRNLNRGMNVELDTQNHCVSGFRPSPNVSETVFVSDLRWGEGNTYFVVSHRKKRRQSLDNLWQVQAILRLTVSRLVHLVVRPPSGAHDQIFIIVGHLQSSCCGAPSLRRGRVCNLFVQFAVTLRSKSRRTHNHISLIWDSPPQPGGPGPRIYFPQEEGGPVILLGARFHFRDSQGYGGGILSRLHTALIPYFL
jgi:hypothetical protein